MVNQHLGNKFIEHIAQIDRAKSETFFESLIFGMKAINVWFKDLGTNLEFNVVKTTFVTSPPTMYQKDLLKIGNIPSGLRAVRGAI